MSPWDVAPMSARVSRPSASRTFARDGKARATVEAEVPDGRASATTLVSRSTSFQSRVTPTRVQPAECCTRTMNDGDEPVAAGTWTGEDLVRGI